MPGTEDSVEDMLKFIYVILMNLFRAPYMIPKMHKEADHPEKYSEEERYELARHVIRLMKTTGGIKTKAYGLENLPSEGGKYPRRKQQADDVPCDPAGDFTIPDRRIYDVLCERTWRIWKRGIYCRKYPL